MERASDGSRHRMMDVIRAEPEIWFPSNDKVCPPQPESGKARGQMRLEKTSVSNAEKRQKK